MSNHYFPEPKFPEWAWIALIAVTVVVLLAFPPQFSHRHLQVLNPITSALHPAPALAVR